MAIIIIPAIIIPRKLALEYRNIIAAGRAKNPHIILITEYTKVSIKNLRNSLLNVNSSSLFSILNPIFIITAV